VKLAWSVQLSAQSLNTSYCTKHYVEQPSVNVSQCLPCSSLHGLRDGARSDSFSIDFHAVRTRDNPFALESPTSPPGTHNPTNTATHNPTNTATHNLHINSTHGNFVKLQNSIQSGPFVHLPPESSSSEDEEIHIAPPPVHLC